ncbi:MAG: hypothetical protein LBP86_10140 [Azoarcus sp.]|nr:hypothetical protein [Azoarcus sp.]
MDEIDAAIKRSEAAKKALLVRIRELEEAQNSLLKQIDQIAVEVQATTEGASALPPALHTAPTSPQSPAPSRANAPMKPSSTWVFGGLAIFALALSVILLLRTRQQPIASSDAQADETSETPPPSAATGDTGMVLPPLPHPFVPTLPDWDVAAPAFDPRGVSVFTPDTKVHAYESTIELAEIMLSFGRVNSAVEALTNFIGSHPREAVAPWLKLLEVYRESGQRTEFDKIAHKLNETFNIWTVTWESFDDARNPRHGIEETHHVAKRLQEIWGSRECQAYLQYLLRDNREKTRQGFALTAIDDILCLSAILEYDLGPYTGPTDIFPTHSMARTEKYEEEQTVGLHPAADGYSQGESQDMDRQPTEA